MKFLLHTVIEWENHLVYYDIYHCDQHTFFAQMVENPRHVSTAVDFYFYWEGEWQSNGITDPQLYWLGETVGKYIN